MKDTPDEFEAMYHARLMALDGEERLRMSSAMFDDAKLIVLASLPPELSTAERRVALFERCYGEDFDEVTRERIGARLRRRSAQDVTLPEPAPPTP